jgi:hypothetical protein
MYIKSVATHGHTTIQDLATMPCLLDGLHRMVLDGPVQIPGICHRDAAPFNTAKETPNESLLDHSRHSPPANAALVTAPAPLHILITTMLICVKTHLLQGASTKCACHKKRCGLRGTSRSTFLMLMSNW